MNIDIICSTDSFHDQLILLDGFIGSNGQLSEDNIARITHTVNRLLEKSEFDLSELSILYNFKKLCESGYLNNIDSIHGRVNRLLDKNAKIKEAGDDNIIYYGNIVEFNSTDDERHTRVEYQIITNSDDPRLEELNWVGNSNIQIIFDSSGTGHRRKVRKSKRNKSKHNKSKRRIRHRR
jgi:hypothetical protein